MGSVRQENIQLNVEVNGKRAGNSIATLESNLKTLRLELKHLPRDSEEFIKKSKEFEQTTAELKKIKGEAYGVGKAMDSGTKGMGVMSKATGGLKMAFQAAVAALLPLLAFQKLVELAQHVMGVSSEFTKLEGTIRTVTGASGAELENLTIKTQALSKTFNKETEEIVKAQNALASHMKISNEEALGLIEKGLLAGADLNGDFLEQISEYSPQFKQAGIAAEDFVAELVKAEGAGIFSDKGADVVKEFGLRIREQTSATKDALDQAFGPQYTETLFAGLNDGSITAVDALKSVSSQMNTSGASAKELQTVVADVFGGPGEDAGIEYLKSLQDIGGELDNMIDITNDYTRQQQARLALEEELAATQSLLADEFRETGNLFSEIGTNIQILATQGLVLLVQQFNLLKDTLVGSWEVLKVWGSSLANVWNAITSGDFGAIKEAFSGFGEGSAAAFQEGYTRADREAAARRQQEKEEEAEKAAEAAKANAAKEAEAYREQQEKENEKLRKAREKYQQDVLNADKALQDLRIQLMTDSTEREIAQLELNAQRKIEALVGSPEQIAEQQALIEEQLLRGIEEVRKKQAEAEKAARLKTYEERLEEEAEREEMDFLRLEEKFLLGLETEQQRNESAYELERAALEARLQLIKDFHGEESLEAKRVNNEILALDKLKADEAIRIEQEKEDMIKNLKQGGYEAAKGFLGLAIDLMSEDEEARKKNAQKIKAFQVAETTVNLVKEIQGIWSGYASMGPIGAAIAAIQTGIAAVRGGMAIKKINSQKFSLGGLIKSVRKYAQGGIVKGPSHANGGVPFYNPNSGTIDEMEGDEIILTGGVSRDPRLKAVASMINRAAGGRMFAAGGPVNPYRVAADAAVNGGSTAQAMDQAAGQQAQQANPANEMLISEVRGLRTDVQNLNTRFKAYIIYSELEDAQQEVAEVREDASIQA